MIQPMKRCPHLSQNDLVDRYNACLSEKRYADAVALLELGVQRQYGWAAFKLSLFYMDGTGMDAPDAKRAYELLMLAVQWEPRNGEAHFHLGCLLAEGRGCKADAAGAVHHFSCGAHLGNVESLYMQGLCLHDGFGTERDIPAARRKLSRAAEGGFAPAQEALLQVDTPAQILFEETASYEAPLIRAGDIYDIGFCSDPQVTADGVHVLSWCDNFLVRTNLHNLDETYPPYAFESCVSALAYSRAGYYFATDADGHAALFREQGDALVAEVTLPAEGQVLAFSPDGTLLAVAMPHAVWVFRVPTLQVVNRVYWAGQVTCMRFTKRGMLLAGMAEGGVRLWNLAANAWYVYFGRGGAVRDLDLSPNGRQLLVTLDDDVLLFSFGYPEPQWVQSVSVPLRHAVFHPTEKAFITVDVQGYVSVYTFGKYGITLRNRFEARGTEGRPACTPDGHFLVTDWLVHDLSEVTPFL